MIYAAIACFIVGSVIGAFLTALVVSAHRGDNAQRRIFDDIDMSEEDLPVMLRRQGW